MTASRHGSQWFNWITSGGSNPSDFIRLILCAKRRSLSRTEHVRLDNARTRALLALPGPLELLPGLLVLLPGLLELPVLLHYTASTAGATSATVTAGASSTSTRGACNYG